MSYKKALKKLESLPPGERQLAAGQYVWEVKKGKSHCGCAIGKLLTERQRVKLFKADSYDGGKVNLTGVESLALFLGLNWETGDDTVVADLSYHEANAVQRENDRFGRDASGAYLNVNDYKTRRARYKHIIAWLKEQIATQVAIDATAREMETATVEE